MLKNIQYFAGQNNKQIAYQYRKAPNNSRGTVLILSGLMETSLKYELWIKFLNDKGLDVLIMDNRGMGFSERLLERRPMKVHIDRFGHYVEDALMLLRNHQASFAVGPLYLLTHSTGSLIGTHLLARGEFSFERAVLVAPLYDVYTRGVPTFVTRQLLKTLLLFYKKTAYLIGYDETSYKRRSFKNTNFTHDRAMFDMDSKILADNPQARANGPTFKWLREIFRGCDQLDQVIPNIKCHVDILQAKRDYYVSNRAHKKLQKHFKSSIIHSIEDSYHEILMETKPVREHVEKIIENSFS